MTMPMRSSINLLTLVVLSAISTAGATSTRKLSQEHFLSYEPRTIVTDYAAIDLDQRALEVALGAGTVEGIETALKIYTEGAFSGSYAELQLDAPLPLDVAKGVKVLGRNADTGTTVRGTTATAFQAEESILQVLYYASPVQEAWTGCHVCGNPHPNTNGCFAPTGSLEIGNLGEVAYNYYPLLSNFNARTLQGFSTYAETNYYNCAQCPYRTYNKFYEYYGVFDYANQWVLSAFNKGGTNFAKGNAQFAVYDDAGIAEAVKKGIVYLNTWMYVIGQLEDATDDCLASCPLDECNEDRVNSWDVAVAIYTGSVSKLSSGDGGHMLYTFAQQACREFGTCVQDGLDVGMARVNQEIFQHFHAGQQNLMAGICTAVRESVERITQLMTVPLIQGTLKYAYKMDKQSDRREETEAEGATLAAAILPILNACSSDDTDIVYNNMRVGNGGSASFEVVKAAFERNFECLGITCQDVGGLINPASGEYWSNAEPCGLSTPNTTSAPATASTARSSSTDSTEIHEEQDVEDVAVDDASQDTTNTSETKTSLDSTNQTEIPDNVDTEFSLENAHTSVATAWGKAFAFSAFVVSSLFIAVLVA